MAPNRGAFTKIVTTDTSATSLVVGGADGAAATGTGGVYAGTYYAGTSVETDLLFSDATLTAQAADDLVLTAGADVLITADAELSITTNAVVAATVTDGMFTFPLGISERARSVPVGEWADQAFDEGDYTSDSGSWQAGAACPA